MNPKPGFCLLAALLLSAAPQHASAQAAAEGQPGAAPSPSYVWMSGHWNSENGQWKWVAAHWDLPPARNALWVGGHWAAEAGKWVWVNGAWNVSDPGQAQSSPPEAPAGQAQPGVPLPSTPPPLPEGDLAADGTVKAVQMIPMTTDYGPIDYSISDPGAYWAGDPYWAAYPWIWGYPGAYVGLGWGPGYYGYGGRGGYWGHGYHSGAPGWRGGRPAGGHAGGSSPVRGVSPGRSPGGHAGGAQSYPHR